MLEIEHPGYLREDHRPLGKEPSSAEHASEDEQLWHWIEGAPALRTVSIGTSK